jgi:hypothetical protein
MTQLELAPEVLDDFDRFFDHIPSSVRPPTFSQRISDVISALDSLAHSPLIGQTVKGGNRELSSADPRVATLPSIVSCLTSTPSSCLPCAANAIQTTWHRGPLHWVSKRPCFS